MILWDVARAGAMNYARVERGMILRDVARAGAIRYWRAQRDRTRLRQREDVDHDRDVDHLCARVSVCVCPLSQAVARAAVRPSPDHSMIIRAGHWP
jgi:hypothetical protein